MARMIPSSGPRPSDPRSKEGVVYQSLATLSDDFTVVHSMSIVSAAFDTLKENEADFVVFNKDKGMISFEVKAGQVSYCDGEWLYANGLPMKHGGPFNQAQNIKFRLMDEMRDKGLSNALRYCRIYHAVWFPSVSRSDLDRVNLPEEADSAIVLTKDDLADPLPAITRIFDLDVGRDQAITDAQAALILERVLCPEFGVTPTARTKYDFDDLAFARLLDSQINVLNFLQEQKSAVVNGVAGSGKTLIAVEQAKRASARGEKVLFLCYNKLLCENVRERCATEPLVDVYTLDAFAYKICGVNDYGKLQNALLENPLLFPYQHLVIDEGQDFGGSGDGDNAKSDLLEVLKLLVGEHDGTFYMFYDKYQLIQGSGLPDFINESDCKLTLWVNCRNTYNIAKCATKALDEGLACQVRDLAPDGTIPKMTYSLDVDELASHVDRYIHELRSLGLTDVVILTCKTEASSIVAEGFTKGADGTYWKTTHIPVYSCRRFKGLEADAVILIDVTPDLWVSYESDSVYKALPGLIFYTGASRAKHELRIVCDMGESDFEELVEDMKIASKRNPVKSFAKRINALPDGRH